ncbi:MAG TPA: hypothetical protein VGO59_16295 [Verrucomicrobiae bacterium]
MIKTKQNTRQARGLAAKSAKARPNWQIRPTTAKSPESGITWLGWMRYVEMCHVVFAKLPDVLFKDFSSRNSVRADVLHAGRSR